MKKAKQEIRKMDAATSKEIEDAIFNEEPFEYEGTVYFPARTKKLKKDKNGIVKMCICQRQNLYNNDICQACIAAKIRLPWGEHLYMKRVIKVEDYESQGRHTKG